MPWSEKASDRQDRAIGAKESVNMQGYGLHRGDAPLSLCSFLMLGLAFAQREELRACLGDVGLIYFHSLNRLNATHPLPRRALAAAARSRLALSTRPG
jgi:hypothetical protein